MTDASGIGASRTSARCRRCGSERRRACRYLRCNDTAANRLWLNRGDGTFKEMALEAGVAYDINGRIKAGMGVTAEQVDDQARWRCW